MSARTRSEEKDPGVFLEENKEGSRSHDFEGDREEASALCGREGG